MDAKDMCIEFLSQIKRMKKTQLQFCEDNGLDYSSFKALTDKVITCDKDARVDANAFCTTHYYWMRGQ